MGLIVTWQMRFNGDGELFKMQKAIELWNNNSGEMLEFDSKLYFRVAYLAFLIPLGSGEFSVICNLSMRVKICTNSPIHFFGSDSLDMR